MKTERLDEFQDLEIDGLFVDYSPTIPRANPLANPSSTNPLPGDSIEAIGSKSQENISFGKKVIFEMSLSINSFRTKIRQVEFHVI